LSKFNDTIDLPDQQEKNAYIDYIKKLTQAFLTCTQKITNDARLTARPARRTFSLIFAWSGLVLANPNNPTPADLIINEIMSLVIKIQTISFGLISAY